MTRMGPDARTVTALAACAAPLAALWAWRGLLWAVGRAIDRVEIRLDHQAGEEG